MNRDQSPMGPPFLPGRIAGSAPRSGRLAVRPPSRIGPSGGRYALLSTRAWGKRTITLGGAVSSTGGTGTGIILNSNSGATINFTGGISLTTNANDAFTATGGGTVNVSGTNNVTTTSGKGINWSTDTSASTVTFNNVTSTTGTAVTIASSSATDFTFNDVTSTSGTAVSVTTATGDFVFHAGAGCAPAEEVSRV